MSLALGFSIGSLAPGDAFSLTLRIAPTAIGGLQQFDPDSLQALFFNGYAVVRPATPDYSVGTHLRARPGTLLLVAVALPLVGRRFWNRR